MQLQRFDDLNCKLWQILLLYKGNEELLQSLRKHKGLLAGLEKLFSFIREYEEGFCEIKYVNGKNHYYQMYKNKDGLYSCQGIMVLVTGHVFLTWTPKSQKIMLMVCNLSYFTNLLSFCLVSNFGLQGGHILDGGATETVTKLRNWHRINS